MKTLAFLCLMLAILNVVVGLVATVLLHHTECRAMLAQSFGTLVFSAVLYLTMRSQDERPRT